MQKILLTLFIGLLTFPLHAQLLQERTPTRADSLRGGLRPERTNYDVLKYDLSVEVIPEKKYIQGKNTIDFKVVKNLQRIQLDLFENMKIDSILFQNQALDYKREYNAVFIDFPEELQKGEQHSIDFYYSGNPIIAENPPWDGGFIFTKDENGKDWISVAVQGTGASLWYPNKDHPSDEPEEAEIHVTTPKGLMDVSNGRLTDKKVLPDGRTTWSWKVTYPINNYNLILNIGDYVHFSDRFEDIDLDFYALPHHLEKAKKQFAEAKDMLACFSEKFGEYPFKRDGYKLVETPYLGMEHQSAVGYGNGFKMGYAGMDISGSGVGMKFDFIIIHESAHEWFGNSITASDAADMWIQEAFTSYAEAVYVECRWGKEDAVKYITGFRNTKIANKNPIIGNYGVNQSGSGDMYYKGSNFLHTLRTIVDNDKKWWKILKGFYQTHSYQIINASDVYDYFNTATGRDLTPIFDQYLRYSALPEFQIKQENGKLSYRWATDVDDFEMPIQIDLNGETKKLKATNHWKNLRTRVDLKDIQPDTLNNYIDYKTIKLD